MAKQLITLRVESEKINKLKQVARNIGKTYTDLIRDKINCIIKTYYDQRVLIKVTKIINKLEVLKNANTREGSLLYKERRANLIIANKLREVFSL